MSESIGSLIAWVKDRDFSLNLNTERLAFIFALNAIHSDSDRELLERDLIEAFRMVLEEFRMELEFDKVKFTAMIDSLVSQRILLRIRVQNMDEANYRLTPLGVHLSEAFVADHELSEIKINIQMSTVVSKLSSLAQKFSDGKAPSVGEMYDQLRFSIIEDLVKVDTIQRNLDEEQQDIQKRIWSIFELKWNDALDEINTLLSDTADKIKQVTEIIGVQADAIETHVNTISMELPEKEEYLAIHELLERLLAMLERITSWSVLSFRQWKVYDNNLLDYIKKLVNVDSTRQLSHRLMQQLRLPEEYAVTIVDSDEVINLGVPKLRPVPKKIVGQRRVQSIKSASELPKRLSDLVGEWVQENIDFTKDIFIPDKVGSAISFFENEDPLVIAQIVIKELQARKRPVNSLRKAVWTDVEGLGRIKSKLLERNN
ncbi:hypothetical protein [Alteromonas macleodii]|uniref:hypothetical protein n=1 Tax=Alteromonas macleodii TaxID=28108 RepID=UPI0031404B34|tara:strand:- start:8903 stop:10189 length:1287 start_codon:yes stop_codon:yes gene_type:complete